MILLKANKTLNSVFEKMIHTMGEDVTWEGIFIIKNNDIILAGEKKSLFLNFDNRYVFSRESDLMVKEIMTELVGKNQLLENTLNIILYAFGKWGEINGLTVEMDYSRLNRLLNRVLAEIDVEARLTDKNLRFFHKEIPVTYEDVIQSILNQSRSIEVDTEDEKTDEPGSEESKDLTDRDDYGLGLWHNVRWLSGKYTFEKAELTPTEKEKLRLGNNFYPVNYLCPDCGDKLFMVVYPAGKEFRIETDEDPVYMARAYTCSSCHHLYTPKPHKLLVEGDVYHLNFEGDKAAYEDYLELLGRQGDRTSTSNFNLYESEYNKRKDRFEEADEPSEEEGLSGEFSKKGRIPGRGLFPKDEHSEEKELFLKDKLSGRKDISEENETPKRKESFKKKGTLGNSRKAQEDMRLFSKEEGSEKNSSGENRFSGKAYPRIKETGRIIGNRKISPRRISQEGIWKAGILKERRYKFRILKDGKPKASISKTEESNARISKTRISKARISKARISEARISKTKKSKAEISKVRISKTGQSKARTSKSEILQDMPQNACKDQKLSWREKAESGRGKSYGENLRLLGAVKKEELPEEEKNQLLEMLLDNLKRSGDKELRNLILSIPENINKNQYSKYTEKIDEYKEADTSRYKRLLEEKRDESEKLEINAFIKQANAKTRDSLSDLYHNLKKQDFSERNVSKYLEEIHNKIYGLDESAIHRICPDLSDITFEDGLELYEEISAGDFLPELKINTLGLIDKRLKRIKMDECEQLVKKFTRDLNWSEEEYPGIYFYNVEDMFRDNSEDASIIIHNALNTYAGSRGKYEYPILICDTSHTGNGKKGFILTPEHIFYRSVIDSEVIDIMNIEKVFGDERLLKKGIYVNDKVSGILRISKSVSKVNLKSFGKTFNEFIAYLKEKPESRSISYLAKEKHRVICCYRCGYVYKDRDVCPRCGSKNNG